MTNCVHCNRPLSGKKRKYCSNSCRGKYYRVQTGYYNKRLYNNDTLSTPKTSVYKKNLDIDKIIGFITKTYKTDKYDIILDKVKNKKPIINI